MRNATEALINDLETSLQPDRVVSALLLLTLVDDDAGSTIASAARDPNRTAAQRLALGRVLDAVGLA
jgi:hypothetical protein